MVIAGFSLKLMYDKYRTKLKVFYKQVFKRFLQFTFLGACLSLWLNWNFGFFDSEVISAIGLNLLMLSVLLLMNKVVLHWFSQAFCYSLVFVLMVGINSLYDPVGSFNIVWVQSFMLFGIFLATIREYKFGYAYFGLILLGLGLFSWSTSNYYARNLENWLLSAGTITIALLIFYKLQDSKWIQGFFGYFGKHALFYYFFHFAIVNKILLSLNMFRTIGLTNSFVLTIISLIVLYVFHHFYMKINGKIFIPKKLT